MSVSDFALLEVIPDFVVHPRTERQLKLLYNGAQHPETGVPRKNRIHHLKSYKQCFYGNEFVTWLAFKQNTTNQHAVRIAHMMQKRGFIKPCGSEKWLQDDQSLYQFLDEEDVDTESPESPSSPNSYSVSPPSPRKRSNSTLERVQSQRSSRRLSFSFKTGFSFQSPEQASPKISLSLGTIDHNSDKRRSRTPSPSVISGFSMAIPDDSSPVSSPLQMMGSAIVTIVVKECNGLVALPAVEGASAAPNPYVKILVGGVCESTEAVASLNPSYNKKFSFKVDITPAEIVIAVLDDNRITTGQDMFGYIKLNIENARRSSDMDDFFALRSAYTDVKAAGKIKMSVHARYSEEALKHVVFGVNLDDLMSRNAYKNMIIPDVIFKCICRIMERHLETVGIYRISGNQQKIKDYIAETDTKGPDLILAENLDEHVTGGLLKIFLRELPEPIIPYSMYNAYTSCKGSIEQFRQVIETLPLINQYFLRFCLCSFYHLALYSKTNMMASVNIATVFGHVICSPPPERNISQQEYISNHLNLMASACDLLVSNYLELYQVEMDTDPAYKFIQEKCNDRQAWEQIMAKKSVQVATHEKEEITQITVEPPVVEITSVEEPSTTVIETEEPYDTVQEPTLVKSVIEKNEETPEPGVEDGEPPAEEKMPVVDKIEEATPTTQYLEEPQPESTVDAIVESIDENH